MNKGIIHFKIHICNVSWHLDKKKMELGSTQSSTFIVKYLLVLFSS